MKTFDSDHSQSNRVPNAGEAEATLRLIAGLPAPEGLESRVKAGLRGRPVPGSGGVLQWPAGARSAWTESAWMRVAAAAMIVAVVGGGGWQVYSHAGAPQAPVVVPHIGASAGFGSADARRTPKTLDQPVAPQSAGASKGETGKRANAKKRVAPANAGGPHRPTD